MRTTQNTHDGLKNPLMESMNRVSIQRASDALELQGMALPCHVTAVQGQIVTVAFDVVTDQTLPSVTIPVAASPYFWQPVQIGDKGVTVPADAYLGGVSGLGGGTAQLAQQPANLTALVFVPVANKAATVPDSAQAVVQGANGVLLRALTGSTKIDITPDGITLSAGGHEIVIGAAGVVIDGKTFLTHQHLGVQTGSGESGGVA